MIYYKDDEIKIRDIYDEDIISLFSWRIDKEVNEHDPRPIPQNTKELIKECIECCRRFDNEIINENISDRKYKYFMITNHEDSPIGFVNFFSIDRVRSEGEMGIEIGDKRYWNKGIAYKAVKVATEYIFNSMDIKRIYIETSENNTAALKLFKKLNFTECDEYVEYEGFKFVVMDKKIYE